MENLRTKRQIAKDVLWVEADTQMKLGALCSMLGLRDEAVAAGSKSVELANELNQIVHDDPSSQEALANCYHNYGNTLLALERRDEALSCYQDSHRYQGTHRSFEASRGNVETRLIVGQRRRNFMEYWSRFKAEVRFRRAEELALQSFRPSSATSAGNTICYWLNSMLAGAECCNCRSIATEPSSVPIWASAGLSHI